VFDPSIDRLRLYVDGVLAAETAVTEFETLGTPNVVPLTIGGTLDNNYRSITIDGAVADARAYNGTALTQSQIRSLIRDTDVRTGITGQWKFGETPRSIPSCAGGQSLTFDGVNDEVIVPSGLDNMAQLTYATWVKMLAAPAANLGVMGQWAAYDMRVSSALQLGAAIATDDDAFTQVLSGAGQLNRGQWHHLAITYKTGELKGYIDGVQVGSTITTVTGDVIDNTNLFKFGGWVGYCQSRLDDARVFTSALSAVDIATLAAGGEPATAPVAHWPFDDGPQYGEPSNGDPIAIWEDRNGIIAAQAATSARPTYTQVGANGRPGITFDGLTQHLLASNVFRNDPYGTLVVVAKTDALLGSAQTIVAFVDTATSATYYIYFGLTSTTGTPTITQKNNDTAEGPTGGLTVGTSSVRILSFRSDGALGAIRMDGISQALSGSYSGDWLAETAGIDAIALGLLKTLTNYNPFDGTIYEILYFPRPLSDVQLRKVERQLGAKYGVMVA
jgi:hypothetical protein